MSLFSYAKTKIQQIALINELIEEHGDTLEILLQKVNQGNQFEMYTGKMSIGASFSLIKRLPRDYENLDGVQRALKIPKINNISNLATEDSSKYSQPNAIVVALIKPEDTENGLITINEVHNYPDMLVYKINLKLLLEIINGKEVDENGYIEDEENVFLGILIDGHHRSEGLFKSGRLDFEVPISVYLDLPKEEIFRVFININKYQEKPSNVHTLAIEQEAGLFAGEEEQSVRIIDLLNTDFGELEIGIDEYISKDKLNPIQPKKSILFDRIKTVDAKRSPKARRIYVTNSTFDKLIKENLFDTVSKKFSVTRKAEILNDYFIAWSTVFDDAWNDSKNHVLVKSMGFQIMMKLFPIIFNAAGHDGNTPTKHQFINFIKGNLNDGEKLEFEDGLKIDIKWDSDNFGRFSSGKGIGQIVKGLKQHINAKVQS